MKHKVKGLLSATVRVLSCSALAAAGFTASVHATKAEPTSLEIAPDDPRIVYSLTPIPTGDLTRPTVVTNAGDTRLFIAEQAGRIKVFKNGGLLGTPFLDVSGLVRCCGEEGLLGLAFEPDYANTGRFYIYYTNNDGDQVIARYNVSNNPDIADSGSAQILMTIPHPDHGNHNGGWLGFGPDDNLYAGVGDGGGGGDPFCAAQNPSDWRGKLLRLNVVGQVTYTVPAGNVFTATQEPEVWAIGLRNPWRASFDRQTGDLYIGDVGQSAREEIDFVPGNSGAGLNFGWSQFEGSIPYSDGTSNNGPFDCPPSGIAPTQPITDYDRSLGSTVTGGYVYRGSSYPSLKGVYFYADFGSGKLWAAWKATAASPFSTAFIKDTGINVSTFGEDVKGELYLADYGCYGADCDRPGQIYRLSATDPLGIRVHLPIVRKK
jgi:glucose/arabinose dehydrogenase